MAVRTQKALNSNQDGYAMLIFLSILPLALYLIVFSYNLLAGMQVRNEITNECLRISEEEMKYRKTILSMILANNKVAILLRANDKIQLSGAAFSLLYGNLPAAIAHIVNLNKSKNAKEIHDKIQNALVLQLEKYSQLKTLELQSSVLKNIKSKNLFIGESVAKNIKSVKLIEPILGLEPTDQLPARIYKIKPQFSKYEMRHLDISIRTALDHKKQFEHISNSIFALNSKIDCGHRIIEKEDKLEIRTNYPKLDGTNPHRSYNLSYHWPRFARAFQ
jgi:hypothetical protein